MYMLRLKSVSIIKVIYDYSYIISWGLKKIEQEPMLSCETCCEKIPILNMLCNVTVKMK
jgi:hypothetical protein